MTAHTTINVHLKPDTLWSVTQLTGFITLNIGEDIRIFVHNENQLAEIAQAVDVASKCFS